MRNVILTDEGGNATGLCEIVAAHQNSGKLHKAFSVFVFRNDRRELLIQRRAKEKLFGGLWANTCCSHPLPEETVDHAAHRRLQEEVGFDCDLVTVGSFVYQADDPEGKGAEHEHDTVFVGNCKDDVEIKIDPSEIEDTRWISIDDLQKSLKEEPEIYAPWFSKALSIILPDIDAR